MILSSVAATLTLAIGGIETGEFVGMIFLGPRWRGRGGVLPFSARELG
jgi:hypothetical protein